MRQACKSFSLQLLVAVTAILSCTHCTAPKGYIYGNNSQTTSVSPPGPYIYKIDLATGDMVDNYTNLGIGLGGIGVAVIADTMYYASGKLDCVYTYNLTTKTNNGCFFHIAGATGLGSLAYDGTNLWIQEYAGISPGAVFKCDITVTGTPACVVAFTPSGCSGIIPNCDGVEYLSTTISGCTGPVLVSNRGDAIDPYDAYPLSKNVCNSALITPADRSTGIAWDGQFIYTSALLTGRLGVWRTNGNPAFVPTITVNNTPPSYPPAIEDLSIDYARLYCFPPGRTVYSDGPVNGQSTGEDITFLVVVSDSFVISSPGATINGFCFAPWVAQGDTPTSVDWSITSAPNSGTTFASGTASGPRLTLDFLFTNSKSSPPACAGQGCDVYQAEVSFGSNVALSAGTYYLNLQNGTAAGGSPVYWDVNYGTNCTSAGCPSTAFASGTGGTIPPESFVLHFVN